MNSANPPFRAILCWVMLSLAGQAFAVDWPQWRGPNRDGKVAGFTAPQSWPAALKQQWKVTVGAGDATPALVGERLYVFARQGDEEVILCLDAASGDELWRDKYAAPAVTGPSARQHPGPRSSPAVAGGKVVTLGATGILSALDAADGKVLWRKEQFKGTPKYFTAMSPIIVDGMAVAHLGGPGSGTMIAFDLASGEEKWKWQGDGPAYASPVLLTVEGVKQLVTLTESHVVGVALADGKLLWQIPFEAKGMTYNAATPIVDGQTVIFTGQGRGTKAVKIEKQGDGFAARELWSNAELRTQFNTPVLKDGLLFGLSDRGNFFCINAANGQTAWTDTAKHRNFGAFLDAGSVILALPSSSELIAFKPTGKEYSEVAKIKVADSATFAHPLIVGNKLYVKDRDSLAVLTFE